VAQFRRGCTAPLDAEHQQLGGQVGTIWDNLNIRRSAAMREFDRDPDWLHVIRLPRTRRS
jgi:hypothetical protein